MSLFSRRETSPIPSTNFSVLDSHVTVSGDVETDGALRIDGRVEGSVLRADLIVVGVGASVVGDITAREVIVGGAVTGNIFAAQRTELLSSGIVAGDIRSAAILVQEGGVVQGRLYIHPISGAPDGPAPRQLGSGQRNSGETDAGALTPALLGKST
ncbi:MAG TPA: polymer-forming cytoskeletal protein [Gemmatimonadaceae bacterium]|nr:polymer-forming cytoskeletal protein [Gemmatimonadaceae bacterium]